MIRNVSLRPVGDTQVFTSFAEPEQPTRDLVIMAHGFRGSSIGPARTFVDFENLLLADGFAVFRFDQPGSGHSEGDFFSSSFDSWVDTIAGFAGEYLDAGYRVSLLGQSMGATASVVAAARDELSSRLNALLLWVPDPKSDDRDFAEDSAEEGGQRYPTSFWMEARDSDFFACLREFRGPVHLIYGEDDEYVSPALRSRVIEAVERSGNPALVLPGQGHSSWAHESAQHVFADQRRFLARVSRAPAEPTP